MARNCSGRSEVGGGSNRLVMVGSVGGSSGSSVFIELGANVVRVSEGGMRGKEAVEKMKRSSGWEVGGGAWIIREVWAIVHWASSVPLKGSSRSQSHMDKIHSSI